MYDPTSDLFLSCQQMSYQEDLQEGEKLPSTVKPDTHFVVHTENGGVSLLSKEK